MEVPADGDATMWIYDGAAWLEQPSNGGSSVDLTGYATEAYVGDAIAAIPATDLSDYYTSTEVDNAFQPKGNYIADAPSDGNLYIRKNGAWEVYVPSSGGGGSVGMEPVQQPANWGDFSCQHGGEYYAKDLGETREITLTVPDGMVFIFKNISVELSGQVKESEVYIDGIQMFPGAGGTTSPSDDNDGFCLRYDSSFVVNDTLTWQARKNGPSNNAQRVYGFFAPDSATMRERALEAMASEESSDE
jgi:hypothetical protein